MQVSLVFLALSANLASGSKGTVYMSAIWRSMSGFDTKSGEFGGVFNVDMVWNISAEDTDVRDIIALTNFMEGNNGRVKLSSTVYTPDWEHPMGGGQSPLRWAMMDYIGVFSQLVGGSCFPWDAPVMKVHFHIPGSILGVNLGLFCPEGRETCKAYSTDDEELSRSDPHFTFRHAVVDDNRCADAGACKPVKYIVDSQWEGRLAKSFTWESMICELSDNAAWVECSMRGLRSWDHPFMIDFLPGAMLTIIGFGSFWVPVSQAMPRIATTLIALLCLLSKSIQVDAILPDHDISWIEEFYLLGSCVMFINMIGHFVSLSHPGLDDALVAIQLFFSFPLFLLVLMALLLHKAVRNDCPGMSVPLVVFFFVLSVCAVIAGTFYTIRRMQRTRKRVLQKVTPHD